MIIDDPNVRWKYAVINAYKPIGETDKEWLPCPDCGLRPRVWIFDNGRYAKCCCGDRYDPDQASAESIWSVHKRCGGDLTEYREDDLRVAWNAFIVKKREVAT